MLRKGHRTRSGACLSRSQRNYAYKVYNVGSGYATRNREFPAAITRAIFDPKVELTEAYDLEGPGTAVALDMTRTREDAGFMVRRAITVFYLLFTLYLWSPPFQESYRLP